MRCSFVRIHRHFWENSVPFETSVTFQISHTFGTQKTVIFGTEFNPTGTNKQHWTSDIIICNCTINFLHCVVNLKYARTNKQALTVSHVNRGIVMAVTQQYSWTVSCPKHHKSIDSLTRATDINPITTRSMPNYTPVYSQNGRVSCY